MIKMVNSADIIRMKMNARIDAINGSIYNPVNDLGRSPIEYEIRKRVREKLVESL
jgi:hypothetical protein